MKSLDAFMPAYEDRQFSPYSPAQIFALVADVERYPEFLPWCAAARVLEREQNRLIAELIIRFKGITERYTSEVMLQPHEAIAVRMLEGPFHYLRNHWHFTPEGEGTRIDFQLDFQFRSKLLDRLIGGMFGRAAERMARAFKERADVLYGVKPRVSGE